MKSVRTITILALVLVIIGVGSFLGSLTYQAYSERREYAAWQPLQYPFSQTYPPEMMGGGIGNGYSGMMGQGASPGELVTIGQAIHMMQSIPSYVRVIPSNNTLVFESQQFTVPVLAVMSDEAVNITGTQPPAYATDDVFVIYGLINPTLVMRSGTSVQFTVVNLDDDMYHNLVLSRYGPPYGYMTMQGMMSDNWMPYLPPADYNQNSAHEYSYALTLNQPGTLWYLCSYPDHAESGMYGRIMLTS